MEHVAILRRQHVRRDRIRIIIIVCGNRREKKVTETLVLCKPVMEQDLFASPEATSYHRVVSAGGSSYLPVHTGACA